MDQKSELKVIALFPMTIPASGKTVLIATLTEYFKAKNIELLSISSDKVSSDLIEQFLKEHPDSTQDEAFAQTRKPYRGCYEKAIQDLCLLIKSAKRNAVIFFDKNHPENGLKAPIEIVKQNFPNAITVGILPLVGSPLGNNPFSMCYLASCIQRAIKRDNHETLKGSELKVAAVVISFFKFFQKLDKNALPLDQIIEIPFTNEDPENETMLRNELLQDIKSLMSEKSPDLMELNRTDELKRVIYTVNQHPLGFPDMEKQHELIFQSVQSIH